GADTHAARAHGFAVNQHGAGATLTFTAAVFRAGKLQVVANYAQQRLVRWGINLMIFAVDDQVNGHRSLVRRAVQYIAATEHTPFVSAIDSFNGCPQGALSHGDPCPTISCKSGV